MNCIHLRPTDVLFFRDGRPMTGSLAGHGAAWPLPTMTDAALHAALHRSGLEGHAHEQKNGREGTGNRNRAFGSLNHAGPFPVHGKTWYFPRPLDLQDETTVPALAPLVPGPELGGIEAGSLKPPLRYPVANRLPPDKSRKAPAWLSATAIKGYLAGEKSSTSSSDNGVNDEDFFGPEHAIGIGIDPETGTTGSGEAQGKIYSAHYLRLQESWQLGLIASTSEKVEGEHGERDDLIHKLFQEESGILVGGQQRVCTARLDPESSSPLPWRLLGEKDFARLPNEKFGVKWVLLTPAIFPTTTGGTVNHSGGWLPNWVHPESGQVLLKSDETKRKDREPRHVWRERVRSMPPIETTLVAALTGRPIPVTGWALAHEEAERKEGGAKPTLLAVPAGSVYYFEAETPEAARQLADALNWHGKLKPGDGPSAIINRRSTSMGEKGFGLGVCATWQPYAVHP